MKNGRLGKDSPCKMQKGKELFSCGQEQLCATNYTNWWIGHALMILAETIGCHTPLLSFSLRIGLALTLYSTILPNVMVLIKAYPHDN